MSTQAYRALVNSATGETIQFTAQLQGEDEDVVRFSWRSKPGGEITEHIHPLQEERFNITAGGKCTRPSRGSPPKARPPHEGHRRTRSSSERRSGILVTRAGRPPRPSGYRT